jgi:uncharacterized protein GlcG (DUF336 family)
MRTKLLLCLALTAAMLVPALSATNVVGNWVGVIVVDTKSLPKTNTKEQKAQMDAMVASLKKARLALSLKADHTFALASQGGAVGNHTASGKWTQSGDKLTVTTTKEDGKPPKSAQGQTQTMTISKDGKTLTLAGTPMAKVVFRRK